MKTLIICIVYIFLANSTYSQGIFLFNNNKYELNNIKEIIDTTTKNYLTELKKTINKKKQYTEKGDINNEILNMEKTSDSILKDIKKDLQKCFKEKSMKIIDRTLKDHKDAYIRKTILDMTNRESYENAKNLAEERINKIEGIINRNDLIFYDSTLEPILTNYFSSLNVSKFKNKNTTKEELKSLLKIDSKFQSFTPDGKEEILDEKDSNDLIDKLADALFKYAEENYNKIISGDLNVKSVINLKNGSDLIITPAIEAQGIYVPYNSLILNSTVTTSLTNLGDNLYNSTANLVIPEASKINFGLGMDFYIPDYLGMYLKFSFSNKQINYQIDSNKINLDNLGVINANFGFDYLIVPKAVSFYFGIQFMEIETRKDVFKKIYTKDVGINTRFWVPEMGFRVKLNNNIYAELNLKIPTKEFRDLLTDDDNVIPVLRFSTQGLFQ